MKNKTKFLYLLRGLPGSGKSTWIETHKLEPYTICSDKLRLLYPFYVDSDGKTKISQMYDQQVWEMLYNLLEERMKWGQPIIIDATHYRSSHIKPYLEYIKKYNYELKIIDFTDVDLKTAKDRNSKRDELKIVPENVIEKMNKTIMDNNKDIKNNYTTLTPDEGYIDFEKALEEYSHPKPMTEKDLDDALGLIKGIAASKNYSDIIFEGIMEYFPEVSSMYKYDQNNKYHNMNLSDHTMEVVKNLGFEMNNYVLYLGALFHDIGKPVVATLGKDGHLHYFEHQKYGAEIVKSRIVPRLKNCSQLTDRDLQFLVYLVENHDSDVSEDFIENYKSEGLSDKETENLLRLMNADATAHIQIGPVVLRKDITEKILTKFKK